MENKNNKTAANGRITGKTWTLRTVTIKELAALLDNLPPVQKVRGSVWTKDTAANLVDDVKAGLYVPPLVVVAADGKIDEAALVDGQQRGLSLVAAWRAGLLTGDETVVLAIEQGRTVEEAFSVLNIGVPVGGALVSAMGIAGKAGEAIVKAAAHPYFDDVRWTGVQTRRTERAAFAATAVAIFAGWIAPSSVTKDCSAWLTSNADLITDAVMEDVTVYLDQLKAATDPLVTLSKVKGKDGAPARKVLAQLRKKSMFSTTCGMAAEGNDVSAIIAVWNRYDELLNGQEGVIVIPATGKSKERTKKVKWPEGSGSSGSADDYAKRAAVFRAALVRAEAAPVPVEARAEARAAEDVADIPTADLEKSFGFKVEEG